MVIRVFRVRIDPALRKEFETAFETVSKNAFSDAAGFLDARIGRPTRWSPDEYVMISHWRDVDALRNFCGERWNEAHIPPEMEKYSLESWVHHYVDDFV